MTLGGTLRQFMENFARALAITSASPEHTNRVKEVEFFGESGNFDNVLREDVIKIIQDEIKIQLTEFRDPGVKPETPTGSAPAQVISEVKKGIGTVQNPAIIASDLMKILPQTALVTLAASLVPMILEEITRDGGIMDTRWKRLMQKEQNAFLARQTQRDTQIGVRQVIISNQQGFRSINTALNSNNLRDIRQGGVDKNRLAGNDLTDFTRGLWIT